MCHSGYCNGDDALMVNGLSACDLDVSVISN